MKNIILFTGFILVFFSGHSQVQNSRYLDAFLQKIDNSNLIMGNISISKEGKEIYQYSLGYRNIDKKIKNSDQTKFRIGSISKSFTAVMIMQLIEEEKLSLNDKLATFLPKM